MFICLLCICIFIYLYVFGFLSISAFPMCCLDIIVPSANHAIQLHVLEITEHRASLKEPRDKGNVTDDLHLITKETVLNDCTLKVVTKRARKDARDIDNMTLVQDKVIDLGLKTLYNRRQIAGELPLVVDEHRVPRRKPKVPHLTHGLTCILGAKL